MTGFQRTLFLLVLCVLIPAMTAVAGGKAETKAETKAAEINYPTKPIQFVVPANPGGGTDLGARLVAEYLKDVLKQNIVITNMDGAGGTVAANYVHDARNDGYTLLYQHEAFVANRVFGLSKYNLKDDYVTVGGVFEVDTVCLFSKTIKSAEELKAKAAKQEVILGTEVGTSFHILFAAMKDKSGLNLKFVDTGAVSPTLAAMEGGQIDLAIVPLGVIKKSVDAGRYHVLGLTSAKERSKFVPDVPTLKELGVDVYMPKFFFLALPPKTPEAIAVVLREGLKKVMQNPEFQKKAEGYFYKAGFLSPENVYDLEKANFEIMNQYFSAIKKK
jgi:tripartite-type tricarboxylate transporter receptor subunit TctC